MPSKLNAARRLTSPLLLALGLTACATSDGFCPVPIHPDPITRAWLERIGDPEETPPDYLPPPQVNQYLHLIGQQQKAIEQACPPLGDAWVRP